MHNTTLKCIIADDEDLAVQLLLAYAAQHAQLEVVAHTTHAAEVPALLQQHKAHLVFLDIQMPQVSGLALAEQLQGGPMIVFTTAYAQHAVEGFRLNAVDYLLKPFSYERFAQAADKCLDYYQYLQLKQQAAAPGFIFVKADGRMVKLLLTDILFVEGWKQYVKIYTVQKNLLVLESMKNMEDALPAGKFVRVHKSYIAAVDKTDIFSPDELRIGSHTIPVGRTYRDAVRRLFGG